MQHTGVARSCVSYVRRVRDVHGEGMSGNLYQVKSRWGEEKEREREAQRFRRDNIFPVAYPKRNVRRRSDRNR